MKKIFLFGTLIVLMLAMSYGVYGAIDCSTEKADSGDAIGATMFNATFTGITVDIYNATSAILYLKCTDTANNAYVVRANDSEGTDWTNQSDGAIGVELNITYDTSGMEDGVGCYAYITVSNHTYEENELTCSATSAFTIDNKLPTTPTLTYDDYSAGTTGLSFSNTETVLGLNDIIYATVGDFSNITSPCTLYFNNDRYTLTEGTTSAIYTLLRGKPSDRFYPTLYATCTDGLNTSTSTIYEDIEVDSIKEGSGTASLNGQTIPIAQEAVRKKQNTGLLIVIAAVAGFFALSIFYKKQ